MSKVDAEKYTKMREQYLAVGSLLADNLTMFQKIEQNQEEIKEILKGGWGY